MESKIVESLTESGGIYVVLALAVVLFFNKFIPLVLDHISGKSGGSSSSVDSGSTGNVVQSDDERLVEIQKEIMRLTIQVEVCGRNLSQLSSKMDDLIVLLNRVDIRVSESRMRGL